MTQKSELGKWGEDRACEYLVDKGFRILDRNYKRPWGELDIVAMAPDRTLVFVEVKTMGYSFGGLEPEHHMTAEKMRRFKRVASLYAGRHQDLVADKKGWRLDLLALTEIGENFDIRHYENIA
ncbi:MAG: YraN family protein [Candidatus Brennerbacteria bacterium]|nr:YraN family protein [Candidatus Brennerbacteria bacterium]